MPNCISKVQELNALVKFDGFRPVIPNLFCEATHLNCNPTPKTYRLLFMARIGGTLVNFMALNRVDLLKMNLRDFS